MFDNFWKGKIIKAPEGFEVMTYKFAVNALTHCAMLLYNSVGKELNYKIVIHFTVYVTIWRCYIPPLVIIPDFEIIKGL